MDADGRPGTASRRAGDGHRPSGIDLVGDMDWGTHFCVFYETPQDLLEILVPYFRKGLEGNEYCMWVTSPPLGADAARAALRAAVPDLDERIRAGQLEILDHDQWYVKDGRFEEGRVLEGWVRKLEAARSRGFEGLRATGDTFWLTEKDRKDFTHYEETVNGVISRHRMLAICTYPLEKCGAPEIMDVMANHQFAMVKRRGRWALVESSERRLAEDAQRASEARLRGILDATKESIWMFDADGTALMANTIALSRIGKGAQDILGKRMGDIISPKLAQSRMERLREVVESRRPVEFEDERAGMRFRHSFYPVLDNAGAVTSVVSFSRDITERKRAEQALAEARSYLENLIDHANAPIIVWSPDLRITRFNRAFEVLSGYTSGEVTGERLELLFPQESKDGSLEKIERTATGEFWESIEIPIRRKDGSIRIALWNSANIHDRDGKTIISTIAQGQDITERKRAEEALREAKEGLEQHVKDRTSELEMSKAALEAEMATRSRAEALAKAERQRFYEVLETLPVYVILLSPDYHVPFANRVFRERFGESKGRRCFDFLFKRERPCENCKTYDALKNNSPLNWEWTGPDGRDYDIYDYPFTDVDGSPLILEMGIDITVRKRAEEELRRVKENLEWQVLERTHELAGSEKKYRAIFESSVNQLVLVQAVRDEKGNVADWRYIDVNENGLQAMGLKREQLIGRTAREVIPNRVDAAHERWMKVLSTGRPVGYETDYGGRHFMVSVFRMDQETIVSSSMDITERKKAESALKKALERNAQQEKLAAIGRLAGGVAHEIRNPLAAMKNAVYYLKLALESPDQSVTDTLELLENEIARSESVITSLLGLAHPGRQARSEVDVNRMLRELLRQRVPGGVEAVTDLDETISPIRADPAQLAIVFGNIIRNAREAMPGGGRLSVTSRAEPGWVSVSISDTGQGMTDDVRARLFEPLMTTKDRGMGLGLPVAKTLVEGHGGTIEVESEPGKGSTFTIRLPVKQGQRTAG